MKKLLKIFTIVAIMIVYSTNALSFVPVVVATGGHKTKETCKDKDGNVTKIIEYEYDADGNVTKTIVKDKDENII